MVMVLEQEIVNEIAQIARLRAPNEACGILLPYPHRGRSVWELPNRAKNKKHEFVATGEDMMLVLEGWLPEEPSAELISGITVWHTHPRGNLGPSKFDLQNKPAFLRSLVVTLYEDGTPPKATWY